MSALSGPVLSAVRVALPTRRVVGPVALAGAVCASAWIAAGAAGGPRWLELPSGSTPGWIEGPLHALSLSLAPSALTAALLMLTISYLVAVVCAGAIGLRGAIVAITLANLAFTLGPTLVSSDVFGYVAYAREAALHGLNPYVSPPLSIPHDGVLQFVYWKHQTSPYGPLFTLLSIPLGLVSAGAALWAYKVIAGLAAVALAFVVAEVARARGINPVRAALFVGLNPVLLVYAVSGAHNDLLGALAVACAFLLVVRGREASAGFTALAAGAIKVTLGLALPFVLIAARRRRAGLRGVSLAVAVLGAATVALFGTHIFDQLHRITSDPQFDIAWSGPDLLARALGTHINGLVRFVSTSGALLVAVAMLAWALRGGDAIVACAWAFLALLASIASLAPWYLVWLLPLAAMARSRVLNAVAVGVTLYLLAVHLPLFGGVFWLSPPSG